MIDPAGAIGRHVGKMIYGNESDSAACEALVAAHPSAANVVIDEFLKYLAKYPGSEHCKETQDGIDLIRAMQARIALCNTRT